MQCCLPTAWVVTRSLFGAERHPLRARKLHDVLVREAEPGPVWDMVKAPWPEASSNPSTRSNRCEKHVKILKCSAPEGGRRTRLMMCMTPLVASVEMSHHSGKAFSSVKAL